MPECRTCLHLAIGRRFVRCGGKAAPREALPWLEVCARWERADDALNNDYTPIVQQGGPWMMPEASDAVLPVEE